MCINYVGRKLKTGLPTKAALTVRWLSMPSLSVGSVLRQGPDIRLIVCTGATMQALVSRLYAGVRETDFEPQHEKGRLSNEFRCYANFESEAWGWS